jgi:mono/diheme cytochrome c family protein
MSPRVYLVTAAGALLALLPVVGQKGPSPKTETAQSPTTPSTQKPQQPAGQKLFQQNCARCHEAPQSFPPQISGTVLRHMRVRASLSAADEKALMEFMNP